MMKSCVLCKSTARIYCDSDQASLCWTCDSKVHSANFLVARHSRSLLCRVCQSPTPWTASGEKLGPSTVSVCAKCVVDGDDDDDREESHGGNDVDDDDEYDGDEDSENEIELEDEEDGDDNQVVPLCCTPPPPSASSSSSSSGDEFSDNSTSVLVKRKRQNAADLSSEDDIDCSSVQKRHHKSPVAAAAEATNEIGENETALLHQALPSSSKAAIVEKLSIIRHRDKIYGQDNSEAVAKATRAIGFDLNVSDSS